MITELKSNGAQYCIIDSKGVESMIASVVRFGFEDDVSVDVSYAVSSCSATFSRTVLLVSA